MDVKIAGESVPGYPQTVMVEEAATPSLIGAAVDLPVRLGDSASFIFDPKQQNGGLKVDVRSPDNQKVGHTAVVFYMSEERFKNQSKLGFVF